MLVKLEVQSVPSILFLLSMHLLLVFCGICERLMLIVLTFWIQKIHTSKRCKLSLIQKLREAGVGTEVKHASIVSKDEANVLREQGVLGIDTPKSLLRAVFYYNGKNFCLQEGKEHCCLKLSQIVRHMDPDHYVYTENGSKNRSGGLWQLRVENKVVPIYAVEELGVRCHVRILDEYISKLPPRAFEMDCFYMKPLTIGEQSKPWYAAQPCGENK